MSIFLMSRIQSSDSNRKGSFPQGGIFRTDRTILFFKDPLADSGPQKTKEIIVPRGKFRIVEDGLLKAFNAQLNKRKMLFIANQL